MAQRTFFIKLNDQKCFNDKQASQRYYKHFIRSAEGSMLTVDNNKTLFNCSPKKVFIEGSTILMRTFFFKHKFDQKLKFESFLAINNYKTKNLLQNILLKIRAIGVKKNLIKSLIILGPKKGGYYGMFLSTSGFIPKSQGKVLFKDAIVPINQQKTSLLTTILFLVSNIFIKKFYAFKISCNCIKMKFYPTYKTYNFSKALTRKTRKNNNIFNFVFYKK
jgi:hypothetical protein